MRSGEGLRLWSLGDADSAERELIERFFEGIERYSPDLVSWNGTGFDLPVLNYRALAAGVQAPRYWETGARRWRISLQQLLEPLPLAPPGSDGCVVGFSDARARLARPTSPRCSAFRASSASPARRCGTQYLAGNALGIRRYCETDVLNTYLDLSALRAHARPVDARAPRRGARARQAQLLRDAAEPHCAEFLRAWEAARFEARARAAQIETGTVVALTHEGEGIVRARQDGLHRRRAARGDGSASAQRAPPSA